MKISTKEIDAAVKAGQAVTIIINGQSYEYSPSDKVELNQLQEHNVYYFIREELSTADKGSKKYVRDMIRGLADIPLINCKAKRDYLAFVNEEWERVTKSRKEKEV